MVGHGSVILGSWFELAEWTQCKDLGKLLTHTHVQPRTHPHLSHSFRDTHKHTHTHMHHTCLTFSDLLIIRT